jgi:hypothetical protein
MSREQIMGDAFHEEYEANIRSNVAIEKWLQY